MDILSPSILAADMLNLGSEIKKIENSDAEYVHIDIMDGCFVPNISFGMPIVSAVRKCTKRVLDVHAMIVNPDKYVKELSACGADIITFHYEALDHEGVLRTIELIREQGKKVGISIKPATPAKELLPYLSLVDMVLVMTVEPGFGGQSFMHDTMEKVKFLRDYATDNNISYDIQVDGGINYETIKIAKNAGANVFVLGTAFFKSEKPVFLSELLK